MKFSSTIVFLGPLFLLGVGALVLGQVDDDDPVRDYYWEKAQEAAADFDPNAAGVSYRMTTRTFRHSVMRDGRISRTDTLEQALYFTEGALDSAVASGGDDQGDFVPDLSYPLVFDAGLYPYLFPNDTGGTGLAIGFRADSARTDLPDGLVVIDRYRYHLRALYLTYPHKEDFRGFSRSFRFVLVEDYLFPDSVWEVATELGIFFSDRYRVETGITDIQVLPAAESAAP